MADSDDEFETKSVNNEIVNKGEGGEGESRREPLSDNPKALTKKEAADCLNCVGETFRLFDYYSTYSYPTYAFLALEATARALTDIRVVVEFQHVVYLDVSHNNLTDESLLPLAEMEQLIALVASHNNIETAAISMLPRLQLLKLRDNRVSTCDVNEQPKLEYLDLNYNNIQEINDSLWGPLCLPELKELELRGNGIKIIQGLNFYNLVALFMGENEIMSLGGIDALTNLKFLHLRSNPIQKLDGLIEGKNKRLFYLNLRDCKIKKQSELRKLKILPRLERLVLADNPVVESLDSYRLQMILLLPKLRRIDKTEVTDQERLEAKEIAKEEEEEKEENEENEIEK